jgi:CBS domain-containing protein
MENSNNSENGHVHDTEFKRFATKRIIVVILLAVVALWVVTAGLGFFDKPAEVQVAYESEGPVEHVPPETKAEPEASHKPMETPGHTAIETEGHPGENTAGSIMSADFIAMDKDLTAGEAIAYLKKEHPEITRPFHLFVVDGHENLLGMVSLKQLMFAPSDNSLGMFMTADIISVNTGTDNGAVKDLMAEHHLQVVPVIDITQKLVGVVKADQVIHLAQKEPVETVSHTPEPAHTETVKTPEHLSPPLHGAPAVVDNAPPAHGKPEATGHSAPAHGGAQVAESKPKPTGVAFVEATIKPLEYELNEKFWGWRPNDILDFTDNVNSYQLGVLEVTRRTVVSLTERISRTGSTAAFDKNLENAMNWFMVKASRYWFRLRNQNTKQALPNSKFTRKNSKKEKPTFTPDPTI